MVLPWASRRQRGVLNVLQLKHCTWGFLGSSESEFWRYEDSEEEDRGRVTELLRTEFAVAAEASGTAPSSASALLSCDEERRVGSVGRKSGRSAGSAGGAWNNG